MEVSGVKWSAVDTAGLKNLDAPAGRNEEELSKRAGEPHEGTKFVSAD